MLPVLAAGSAHLTSLGVKMMSNVMVQVQLLADLGLGYYSPMGELRI